MSHTISVSTTRVQAPSGGTGVSAAFVSPVSSQTSDHTPRGEVVVHVRDSEAPGPWWRRVLGRDGRRHVCRSSSPQFARWSAYAADLAVMDGSPDPGVARVLQSLAAVLMGPHQTPPRTDEVAALARDLREERDTRPAVRALASTLAG